MKTILKKLRTCQWGQQARRPCQNPAVCIVTANDGSKTPTCNLHRTVAERVGWEISNELDPQPSDAEQLATLRASVASLVEKLNHWYQMDPDSPPHEWCRAERETRKARDQLLKNHPEIAAFRAENKGEGV